MRNMNRPRATGSRQLSKKPRDFVGKRQRGKIKKKSAFPRSQSLRIAKFLCMDGWIRGMKPVNAVGLEKFYDRKVGYFCTLHKQNLPLYTYKNKKDCRKSSGHQIATPRP